MSTIKVDTYLTRGGASEIAIDKIKGVTAAGSMLVVGEGGTNTTNLQQGLAKAWCLFDQTAPEIDESFNSASLTDTASGKGIVNWTNNMGGALTYSCTMGTVNGNDANPYCSALTANRAYVTQTTSAFPFRSGYSGHAEASGSSPYAAFFDPNGALVVAHGDLA
jgi:hypothetical protein